MCTHCQAVYRQPSTDSRRSIAERQAVAVEIALLLEKKLRNWNIQNVVVTGVAKQTARFVERAGIASPVGNGTTRHLAFQHLAHLDPQGREGERLGEYLHSRAQVAVARCCIFSKAGDK